MPSATEQHLTRSSQLWVRDATSTLRRVLLCAPDYYHFEPINTVTRGWMESGFTANRERMQQEWQLLAEAYRQAGVSVELMDPRPELQDECFSRDFGAMVAEGALIGRFLLPERAGETAAYERKLKELGVPTLARCQEGAFEGGDFWMLGERDLLVGQLERSNQAGIDNIAEQLRPFGYQLLTVHSRPENLHLDMVFSIAAEGVCLAVSELLAEDFLAEIRRRHFTIIDVPASAIPDFACNVQGLGEGRVLVLAQNTQVNHQLAVLGLELIELEITEILKGGGGLHCLSFPLERW